MAPTPRVLLHRGAAFTTKANNSHWQLRPPGDGDTAHPMPKEVLLHRVGTRQPPSLQPCTSLGPMPWTHTLAILCSPTHPSSTATRLIPTLHPRLCHCFVYTYTPDHAVEAPQAGEHQMPVSQPWEKDKSSNEQSIDQGTFQSD